MLRFQYDNEYNSNAITLKVTDLMGTKRTELPLDSSEYAVRYGPNYMQLNLNEAKDCKTAISI